MTVFNLSFFFVMSFCGGKWSSCFLWGGMPEISFMVFQKQYVDYDISFFKLWVEKNKKSLETLVKWILFQMLKFGGNAGTMQWPCSETMPKEFGLEGWRKTRDYIMQGESRVKGEKFKFKEGAEWGGWGAQTQLTGKTVNLFVCLFW